jgi:hypothetical protein
MKITYLPEPDKWRVEWGAFMVTHHCLAEAIQRLLGLLGCA